MLRQLLLGAGLLATATHATAPSINVAPSTLNVTTATVTVSWSGVSTPQSTDWVSAYCVGASVSQFGSWNYVTTCNGDWSKGACDMQFTLSYPDYRCDVEFRYYRDPSPYTLVATSNAVHWTGGTANSTIRQVHIAFGKVPQSQMFVSWRTDDPSTSLLQIGTSSGVYNLPNVTAAAAVTYAANDTCWANPGWKFPGYFHHALVTQLTPATRYYARPVQGTSVGQEIFFVTGKPLGPDVGTAFIVYGDMGTSGGSGAAGTAARVAARTSAAPFDFALHVGDLSYGEGNVGIWDAWLDLIEPYASRLPYLVSPGNHEFDFSSGNAAHDPSGDGGMWHPSWWDGGEDSQGECGVPTARRFRTPGNGNGVFWYSFSVGNVHIAMISSEHDPSPGSPLGDWLIQDLASVDRSVTPWVLVGIHRPLYETEQYADDYLVAQHLRQIMEPYLLRYGVDVVLAGHYHSFQRTCAVANLTCVKTGGIVHYTTGAAGASLDAVTLYPSDYIENTILGVYGYSVVSAPNASALRLSFFANEDDSIRDDVWIYKN